MSDMTDDKTSNGQSKTQARTTGLVALAVISLLAGASVGASLEEFAAPEYAEDDWMAGVVDDATDDEDWDERESDDGPMKKGAKDFIRGMMSKSMDDRMDDRVEHLEQRIAAGEELIIALRFCIEESGCEADFEMLHEMVYNMETKHAEMREKIDSEAQEELEEEEVARMTDSDPADDRETTQEESEEDTEEEERFDCETDEEWSEEKQAWCEENLLEGEGEEWYDCRTREMWSEEKQAWCDEFLDKGDWDRWDDDRKKVYSEDRAQMLEAASTAIAYCLENDACTADAAALTAIHDEMTEKHDRHVRCAEGEKCHRGKDDRRGLMQRFSDAIFGGPKEMEDREDFEREIRTMADLEVPQEVCEERGGVWVADGDTSVCEWPEYDRDCDKDKDREEVEDQETEEEREGSDEESDESREGPSE